MIQVIYVREIGADYEKSRSTVTPLASGGLQKIGKTETVFLCAGQRSQRCLPPHKRTVFFMESSLLITIEDSQNLLWYCNEWLGIWNEKYLSSHYLPQGIELNFPVAFQVNDVLSDGIVDDVIHGINQVGLKPS